MGYIGRFAPSPTGPLHLGSLFTALISYLHARQQQGKWLLRIDDIDPPREMQGSKEHILQSLQTYGLEWDGAVIYQSEQSQHYQQAIEQLKQQNMLFWCSCSRKQLAAFEHYPGTCYGQGPRPDCAIRLHHPYQPHWLDQLQGPQCPAQQQAQDFVIQRRDGLYSYHLASVVDDHLLGITDVVRGCDLMDSTGHHACLQQSLNIRAPRYWHLPVILAADGQKLSKQTGAQALSLGPDQAKYQLAELINALVGSQLVTAQQPCREQLFAALQAFDINKLKQLTAFKLQFSNQ